MAITWATITKDPAPGTPRIKIEFVPQTTNNTVTIAAEGYTNHGKPFTMVTATDGSASVQIPLGLDQNNSILTWDVYETPLVQIPFRDGGPLSRKKIADVTITTNRGYASLISGDVVPLAVTPIVVANVAAEANRAEAARNAAQSAAGVWQASTVYGAGAVVQFPDGSRVTRNTAGTSRATLDATEKALWTPVSTTAGTMENAALARRLAVNVLDYGADPTKTVSSKAAIEAALAAAGTGATIYIPPGNYLGNNILISTGVKIYAPKATLYKDANGPALIFDAKDIDCDLRIQGEGATYTGVGVEIRNAPDYRWRGDIKDTASYCIDHTTNDQSHRGAITGPAFLQTRGGTLPSVRMPPNELATSGARTITNIFTGGGPLVDLAGATMTYIIGCNFTSFVTSSLSKAALFLANRIASAPTLHGTNLVFIGNDVGAAPFTLDTDCSQAVIVGNRIVAPGVVDNGINNTVVADRVTTNDVLPQTVDARLLGNTATMNANQRVYERVTIGRGRISKIALHVAASSGNINVAVYSGLSSGGGTLHGSTAVPGAKRADSGSVPCPAVGYAELALDSTINVTDQDWFSLCADNTVAAFYRAGANGTTSNIGKGIVAHQNSAFTAPATATPLTSALFSFILVGVT